MPSMPARVCLAPGCPNKVYSLALGGYCPTHAKPKRQHERRYAQGETHYGRAKWLRLRDRFRADHPFCVNADRPAAEGCTLVAEVIDHITPHRGDARLMYDESNLQAMCARCHSRKTARETRPH